MGNWTQIVGAGNLNLIGSAASTGLPNDTCCSSDGKNVYTVSTQAL
jgi:hypothetical protein